MTTPHCCELLMAEFVPGRSDVERETVVDSDLLPWRDGPGSSEGADEAKSGVVNPGPDTAGSEAVVRLVSQSGTVGRGVLGRAGYVDITSRGQVDSNNTTNHSQHSGREGAQGYSYPYLFQ